jgi:hypothetical protein
MITLTASEFMTAGFIGFRRQVERLRKRRTPNGRNGHSTDPVFDQSIEGAVAESIVAEMLNLNWPAKIGKDTKGDIGNGLVEVRCRSPRTSGNEIGIHTDELTNTPYVGVLYHGFFDFEVTGWVYGIEGRERGVWNDSRHCFYVPRPYRDIESLRAWVAEQRRLRITIAPKNANDAARIVAQVGGLLERGLP